MSEAEKAGPETDEAPSATPPLRGVAALPADFALIAPEVLPRALNTLWRASTDRETPTLIQLAGRVCRVEVDAVAGYVAVRSIDDTHYAIGIRRDAVPYLAAHLTKRPLAAVIAELAKGPARIEAVDAPKETPKSLAFDSGDEVASESRAPESPTSQG